MWIKKCCVCIETWPILNDRATLTCANIFAVSKHTQNTNWKEEMKSKKCVTLSSQQTNKQTLPSTLKRSVCDAFCHARHTFLARFICV